MSHIKNSLQNATLNDDQVFKNLTVFMMSSPLAGQSDYLILDEAMANGVAGIDEVSDAGSVPTLLFKNMGDSPVLLLDGEELIGAKQNRILNLTIMAPPQETITIPVSCVEAGRWARTRKGFVAADRTQFARGRAAKAANVSMNLHERGSRASNQSEVWNNISKKSARLGIHSRTDAMSDIYDQAREGVERFVEAFRVNDRHVGAVFGIDGKIVGMDLFDNSNAFRKLFPKLVRSYALDALETQTDEGRKTDAGAARAFVTLVSEASEEAYPSIGLGKDHRFKGARISGGALVVNNQVVHLAAFSSASEMAQRDRHRASNLARASWRRNRN